MTIKWKIGDCLDLMQEMEQNSVDLLTTDPPYGYNFMGKDWDKVVPPVPIWKEALRVLKPGAFAFIMSAPRQDVLAHNLVNLSDAGFETGFTSIYWTYASGFPKAGNIGKLVDKRLGAEREIIGKKHVTNCAAAHEDGYARIGGKNGYDTGKAIPGYIDITVPSTPQAKALDGSYAGFQPKPALEVIMCVMKPLSESTYVDQALANAKGITWLDDGRIPFNSDNEANMRLNARNHTTTKTAGIECFNKIGDDDRSHSTDRSDFLQDLGFHNSQGRFPANLLVSDDVLNSDRIVSKYVPLYGGEKLRDESTGRWVTTDKIINYTIVDESDYNRVIKYRWNLSTFGYVVCASTKKRTLRLHNLLMTPPDGLEVDHIDGNPLNNCRNNLRMCTHQQNMMNQDRVGVYEYKNTDRTKPFWAHIQYNNKRMSLGYYKTFDEAREVYLNKRYELFGEYSRTNINISDSGSFSRYFDLDQWFNTKDLPKEARKTFPFLITPKASKNEKSGATHPTVKPVKLFSWLMTIGSRKGDLVLDPFLGSGTALEAGYLTGRNVIGMELDPQWEKLYKARSHAHQGSLSEWF